MRFVGYAVLPFMMVISLILGGCGPSTWLRTSPDFEEVREVAASPLPVEMALIDPKPALIRYATTFVVPPLAGLLAEVIARML